MKWYWKLSDLLFDDQDNAADLQSELEERIIALYQELLSYQMKSICSYYENQGKAYVRDAVKYDDWTGAIKSIKDAELVLQRDIDTCNAGSIKIILNHIAKDATSQCESLQHIYQAIQETITKQEQWRQTDEFKKCLHDLRLTDPRDDKKRIESTKGGLLRDSYRWILKHPDFRQWCDESDNHLLWIQGDPGKGKTMLLCGIIDELKEQTVGINNLAYFFCQATDAQLNNATAVLRGLIYLLVDQQPSLFSRIQEKYNHAGKTLFEDVNAWVALSGILTNILEDPSLLATTLVIDALDECKTDIEELLNFIVRFSGSSKVKWIVSSRNWPTIEGRLDTAPQKVTLRLELNESSISDAVRKYITYKVEKLSILKKYDDRLRDTVQQHLVSNANNTFLWVALVCQALEDPKIKPRHTLGSLKAFPPGLDPLYDQMMKLITNSIDIRYCKPILATTLVANRPLTLQELMCLVESLENDFPHNVEDIEDIIKQCGSFLTLQGRTVFFVHQSAKDYLLQKAAVKILPSGKRAEHYSIFSRSLQVMSRVLQRDIYHLKDWGVPTDQIKTPDPDPLAAVRYSCIHWVDHLAECQLEELQSGELQDGGIIDKFLQKHYLHWLEALSIFRNVSEGILAISKLNKLVQVRVYRKSDITYC